MTDGPLYREIEVPVFTSFKALAVLVRDVENVQAIKDNLIKGNKSYDYAFINAQNIVSLEQLYSAYYKAMLDEHHGTMKTRTLHTEVIYALSPFKNIMDCLNRFGVSKTSTTLLVLKIFKREEGTPEYLAEQFDNIRRLTSGHVVELDDSNLHAAADLKHIEKNYKIKIKGTPLENHWAQITRTLIGITQLKGL